MRAASQGRPPALDTRYVRSARLSLYAIQRPSGDICGSRPCPRTRRGEPSTLPIQSVNCCTCFPGVFSTQTQVDQTSDGLAVELAARPGLAVVVESTAARARTIAKRQEARNLIGGCTRQARVFHRFFMGGYVFPFGAFQAVLPLQLTDDGLDPLTIGLVFLPTARINPHQLFCGISDPVLAFCRAFIHLPASIVLLVSFGT